MKSIHFIGLIVCITLLGPYLIKDVNAVISCYQGSLINVISRTLMNSHLQKLSATDLGIAGLNISGPPAKTPMFFGVTGCAILKLNVRSGQAISFFGTTGRFFCNNYNNEEETNGTVNGVKFRVKCCYSENCNKPADTVSSCYKGSLTSPSDRTIVSYLQVIADNYFPERLKIDSGSPVKTSMDFATTDCRILKLNVNGYDKAVAYFGTQGTTPCQEINDYAQLVDSKNVTMSDVPYKISCCKQDDCNVPTSASIMSCYQGSAVSPPNTDILNSLQEKASLEFNTNIVSGPPVVSWVDDYGVTGCGTLELNVSGYAVSYFGTTGHFLCKSNDGAYVTEHSGTIDDTPYKVKCCYKNKCNQPSELALMLASSSILTAVSSLKLAIVMMLSAIFVIA